VLPALEYERWCLRPVQAIVAGLRARCPGARVIGFPRATGRQLIRAADGNLAALGLDTSVDPAWAARVMPKTLPLQGNLDPLALVAGGEGLDRAIDSILTAFAGRPHIFNLGHGILPETPIAHVEHLVRRVRQPGA
jgi:uroporphyrinogen decarboxylase